MKDPIADLIATPLLKLVENNLVYR